jgi:2,3-bisphosphoglycerate-dependent phosphoglycerate mutase
MSTFYLIRHAHADWKPDENRPLSIRGKQDAIQVAEVLSPYRIDIICSSPYRRAIQTVGPLAASLSLPIQVLPELRERNLGHPEDRNFNNAVQATWRDPSFSHPGGESNAAAQQRGVSIVNKLKQQYPGAHLVLSTHGNLMALVIQHFDPEIDFAFWKSLTMPDVYRLDIQQEGIVQIARLWHERFERKDRAFGS